MRSRCREIYPGRIAEGYRGGLGDLSDGELIARTADGCDRSLEELMRRYESPAYLKAKATRKAIDRLRTRTSRGRREVEYGPEMAGRPKRHDQDAECVELREAERKAIAALPPLWREAFETFCCADCYDECEGTNFINIPEGLLANFAGVEAGFNACLAQSSARPSNVQNLRIVWARRMDPTAFEQAQ